MPYRRNARVVYLSGKRWGRQYCIQCSSQILWALPKLLRSFGVFIMRSRTWVIDCCHNIPLCTHTLCQPVQVTPAAAIAMRYQQQGMLAGCRFCIAQRLGSDEHNIGAHRGGHTALQRGIPENNIKWTVALFL